MRNATQCSVILFALATGLARAAETNTAWQQITAFFEPPLEFANQFGQYRSPLLFADGSPARSATDWSRRREELLRQWHELMGPWPAVIEKPRVEFLSKERRDNFTQHRVRVEIAPRQTGEGWLLVPEGNGPFPAALVVYYEPETSIGLGKEPLRDFGYQLARRGFVTLNIGTPGGNARQPDLGAALCQPLSFHAYVAANGWQALAHLPEVDRDRIGVVGHSYGGKWAMFAAALWERFACVAVSDPGIVFDETRPNVNYWEPWYLGLDPAVKRPRAGLPTADNPRTGAYKKMIETGRDLHELHALIAPRPFLVSGGSEDPPVRWIALNHAVAVNRLLGYTNRVAMTNRKEHTPNEDSNARLYAFFEHFLGNTPSQTREAATAAPVTDRAVPFDWAVATPESQGMSALHLEQAWADLKVRRTTAFLVIRHDRIVFERCAEGWSRTRPHYTASLAKAVVGGISLMLTMDDGRIQPDDLASRFVPQWRGVERKQDIRVRHLATHTSGIEDAEDGQLPHEQLTGWKGDFWKRLPPPRDPFTLSRDAAPSLDLPGVRARYSNPGMALLAWCVTASLRGSTNAHLRALLKHRVMDPIGVPASEWSMGYGSTFQVDGLELVANWGGGSYSPNALARVGRLMLRKGDWQGRRLVSRAVLEECLKHAGLPNNMGLGWWINRNADGSKVWNSAPVDAFWGSGAGHQMLFVAPSLGLIVVRLGEELDKSLPHAEALEKHVIAPVLRALASAASSAVSGGSAAGPNPQSRVRVSVPPSPVIQGIAWAPADAIVRRASGSDIWAMTWADNDQLYAAYGDGFGFEPFLPEKLSLGFAQIQGGPENFVGMNIRSPTGEQRGDGPAGRKASGVLCLEGVLYLWVRNATNSQLAWSSDHGVNWTWSQWRFTNSFGCPTFLNFGPDYADARDDFVYVYSPDSDSAYIPSDRFVLARAPKHRLRTRDAWEFFVELGPDGVPVWTRDLARRGAVLPGRPVGADVRRLISPASSEATPEPRRDVCYRPNVSYSRALKRYLLVHAVPGSASRDRDGRVDTRFSGGLAIYDAPEPWGPWTTAFFTEHWDVGPGETAGFPTKWMSADGRTLYLAFSGDDCFSVRRAEITLRER